MDGIKTLDSDVSLGVTAHKDFYKTRASDPQRRNDAAQRRDDDRYENCECDRRDIDVQLGETRNVGRTGRDERAHRRPRDEQTRGARDRRENR